MSDLAFPTFRTHDDIVAADGTFPPVYVFHSFYLVYEVTMDAPPLCPGPKLYVFNNLVLPLSTNFLYGPLMGFPPPT